MGDLDIAVKRHDGLGHFLICQRTISIDDIRLCTKRAHFSLNCSCRAGGHRSIKPANNNRRAELAGLHPWIAANANPIMARLDIGKNGGDIALTG